MRFSENILIYTTLKFRRKGTREDKSGALIFQRELFKIQNQWLRRSHITRSRGSGWSWGSCTCPAYFIVDVFPNSDLTYINASRVSVPGQCQQGAKVTSTNIANLCILVTNTNTLSRLRKAFSIPCIAHRSSKHVSKSE